ncbi:relaxase/mobilization nuclease domain-containing protein [Pseudobutyrivibrio ruminis]|uniref:Relaxase/Mobilisation nuclease domain-containing protein n=1 Tax=Pseudobutyrivibrio ruminis DSM 9787 TaxID=1123011 RepID=A0A285RR00_9FIRM|nr:relaxase/mobilization nuclease domain-containing protein [Pseudobutyrivibrio ruminis]SOB96536.1 Relaxase/Mobilisation nuclease domain-containing protein [Pseudobutyrivibrio ruminis DSM 9787]
MAATRLMALHIVRDRTLAESLKERMDYTEDELKTEQKRYISTYGCDIETADEEFLLSHREYHANVRDIRKKEIIAYQIRQSFKPGEITPEKANEIGYELAMRFTKGDYAFTVCTHTDKKHIHNHIVFNAISMDGKKKFRNFYYSGIALRRISDILCFENGLSIIKPAPYAERKKKGRYSRTKNYTDKKLEFIKDIESKVLTGKGRGYVNWAKKFNAKQMAKTILFLQEHKISSYEELKAITDERSGKVRQLMDSMKAKEALLAENKKYQKAIVDYGRTRKTFVAYKKSGYSKKFYAEHEAELLIYKAAEEVYKNAPGRKIPPMQELRDEYGRILAEKKAEFLEYAQIKKDMNEYLIAKKNLELLYQQEEEKKEREGRDKRTRNSHQKDVL